MVRDESCQEVPEVKRLSAAMVRRMLIMAKPVTITTRPPRSARTVMRAVRYVMRPVSRLQALRLFLW